MSNRHLCAGAVAALVFGLLVPLPSLADTAPVVPVVVPPAAAAAVIAHGDYLTHGAGQCMDCHGVGFVGKPTFPGPPGAPWPKVAPSLVGLKMFAHDADAVSFLMTAHLPGGGQAMEPMPRYNFSRGDAESIVAYLRSLK